MNTDIVGWTESVWKSEKLRVQLKVCKAVLSMHMAELCMRNTHTPTLQQNFENEVFQTRGYSTASAFRGEICCSH